MNINQRVVAITGGTSGLGLACVHRLAREGARVAVIAVDGPAVARMKSDGIAAWECDVADAANVDRVFQEIRQTMGPVAVLVNCAGVATPGSILRKGAPMGLDEFRRVVAVNLLGSIYSIRCAAAQMMATRLAEPGADESGVIINTASIAATEGQVGQAAYAASKGGIASMVLPLARELGDYGIRVNAIAPGVFETPMTLSLPEKSRQIVFAAEPPFPRRPGRPDEFADTVAFLIGSPYVNGAVIRLDGGLRMPARF